MSYRFRLQPCLLGYSSVHAWRWNSEFDQRQRSRTWPWSVRYLGRNVGWISSRLTRVRKVSGGNTVLSDQCGSLYWYLEVYGTMVTRDRGWLQPIPLLSISHAVAICFIAMYSIIISNAAVCCGRSNAASSHWLADSQWLPTWRSLARRSK